MGIAALPISWTSAAIQYDVITLPQSVVAYGVDHGRVVGVGLASGAEEGAVWQAPGKAPQILGGVAAYAISGTQIVGTGPNTGPHAILWQSGKSADLNPAGAESSTALATDGTYQGGTADGFAALWNGTAGSVTVLSGPYSAVTSLSDGVQVGYGGPLNTQFQEALLWHGTAASEVILGGGRALGISHGQIVGSGIFQYSSTSAPVRQAAIWTGESALSIVDLGFGPFSSESTGTNGTQQVGYAGINEAAPSRCPCPPDMTTAKLMASTRTVTS